MKKLLFLGIPLVLILGSCASAPQTIYPVDQAGENYRISLNDGTYSQVYEDQEFRLLGSALIEKKLLTFTIAIVNKSDQTVRIIPTKFYVIYPETNMVSQILPAEQAVKEKLKGTLPATKLELRGDWEKMMIKPTDVHPKKMVVGMICATDAKKSPLVLVVVIEGKEYRMPFTLEPIIE